MNPTPVMTAEDPSRPFTTYEKFVIAVLAFLQFTIILDFMILSPLGAILMPALNITPSQFGLVVSGYAFSAGISGFLASGFADRFDRKRMLLFFYIGFIVGTLACALAPNFEMLLLARVVTGLFGGVIGSVVMAITTDLFALAVRGRVIGFIQTAFAASQVLGIPLGIMISGWWGWHAPFLMIVGVSVAVAVGIVVYLQPVVGHLTLKTERTAFAHLLHAVTTPRYILGYALTALLSLGGFMLMPFSSAFTVNNLGVPMDKLPLIYLIPGICTIIAGPLVGRISDKVGHFRVFAIGSSFSIIFVLIYTHMGITPLAGVIAIFSFMMVAVMSRMIPSQVLTSTIPEPQNRGAYMSVSSSLQQVAGGLAAVLAGLIVTQGEHGTIGNFDIIGYVIVGTTLLSVGLIYQVHLKMQNRT